VYTSTFYVENDSRNTRKVKNDDMENVKLPRIIGVFAILTLSLIAVTCAFADD